MATSKKPAAKKPAAKKPANTRATAAKKPSKTTKPKKLDKPAPKSAEGSERLAVGRPTSFKPEYVDLVYKFALLGATDKRMAELFQVSEQTFNAWKHAQPEFLESLTRGRDIADAEIAHSLYHRAKGYEHPEDDIKAVALGNNQGSEIVITPTVKRYPPDTGAAALWLANRQKATWRQKVDHEHSGPNGGPIQTESKVEISADEAYKRMLGLPK